VKPTAIAMLKEDAKHLLEMRRVANQEPIEALLRHDMP